MIYSLFSITWSQYQQSQNLSFTSRFSVYSILDGTPGHKYYAAEVFSKNYDTRKSHFSAEIQIIMFLIIQHAINDLDGSHPDRSRGKSGVHIRIIRGSIFK